jgi:hypothetical protein
MEPLRVLSLGIITNHIYYVLKNRVQNFSLTSKAYIRQAGQLFQNIADNLGHMTEKSENSHPAFEYRFVPNMKALINLRKPVSKSPKGAELKEIAGFFRSLAESLASFPDNPESMYRRSDYEAILEFFSQARLLNQSPVVENHVSKLLMQEVLG